MSPHSEPGNVSPGPRHEPANRGLPDAGAHHGAADPAGMLGCSGAEGVAVGSRLGTCDPITAPADPDLIAAALLFAHAGAGDAEALLLWARYAHRAATHLYGAVSLPALRAAWVYQRVLSRQGLTFAAVVICEQRLAGYRQRGDDAAVLAARISLINTLHADGQCDLAHRDIVELRRQWLRQPGACGFGQQIVLTHAVVSAGCGHTRRAEHILHRNTTVLASLGPFGHDAAALWLATTEKIHPRVCQREPAPLPVSDVADRCAFWLAVLNGDPDATRAGRGRRP